MEQATREGRYHHPNSEINKEYACQKLLRRWGEESRYPSNYMIQALHSQLMGSSEDYRLKGLTPLPPGRYRNIDVSIAGKPQNFLVSGLDAIPMMQRYGEELDRRLEREEIPPSEKLAITVQDAAWAYYTFGRIHPFLDGNGRIGRMIMKRIIKGNGYKDIIFQQNGAYGKGRNEHLDAVNAVDATGNLAHLEVYLLNQLRMRYLDVKDVRVLHEIDELIKKKKEDISSQSERRDISEVWEGFKGSGVDGVKEE